MLFYLIRHADPDYEHDTLTPLGRRQAEALARRLSVHGLDRIYASPMGRAKDTAKPTAELLKLPVTIEPWCSEVLAWEDFSGALPDGRHGWVFSQHNTVIKNEETRRLSEDDWDTAPCFSMAPVRRGMERIRAASDAFFAKQGYVREGTAYRCVYPNDDRIALFCHQGFGMAFLSVLLQIPPQDIFAGFNLSHAGITIFEFADARNGLTQPRCLCLSDTSFLYEDRLPLRYNNHIDI